MKAFMAQLNLSAMSSICSEFNNLSERQKTNGSTPWSVSKALDSTLTVHNVHILNYSTILWLCMIIGVNWIMDNGS